jgi:hypothetical protein
MFVSTLMRRFILAAVISTALAGCGVETATSAATVAAARKQEVEQGKRTMDQIQLKVGAAMEQARRSAERAEDASK